MHSKCLDLNLVLPPTRFVTLSRSFSLSESQLPHLDHKYPGQASRRAVARCNAGIDRNGPVSCLAHSSYFKDVYATLSASLFSKLALSKHLICASVA